RMFHGLYGTPVVLVRLFMTYGPGQAPDKVLPYTILSLLRGAPPRLSGGERPLDWIYVDDVVEAFVRIAQAPGLEGTTIDVGSGEAAPLRAVVRQIVDLVAPSIEPLFGELPDRPFNGARTADVATTYARLGWSPTTSLSAGLRRTVEWYRTRQDGPAGIPGGQGCRP
ncbi:MAG: NAD-dependent epimerase/dehydratase family protein, partial [Candidatus Rokuibacteriota bacterium]